MAHTTRDNFLRDSKKAEDITSVQLESTKDNSRAVCSMDKAPSHTLMEGGTKVNGKMGFYMDLGYFHGRMGIGTRENTLKD